MVSEGRREWPTFRSSFRLLVFTFGVLVVQTTLVLDVRVDGIHPDVIYLLPIGMGIVAGPEEGAIAGFVAGMAADLLLPTPFGLTALVGCIVGYVVGATTGSIVREVWWLAAVVTAAASAAGVVAYAALGALLGQEQFVDGHLTLIIVMVAAVNALVAPLAIRGTQWTVAEIPRRSLA